MTKPDDESIIWRDGSIPVSTRFDDPYYSKLDGRAETRHVFINGNRLAERARTKSSITIAELGFGTGLNFLETWFWFNEQKLAGTIHPETNINFVSFEQFPVTAAIAAQALAPWQALAPLTQHMLTAWKMSPPVFRFEPQEDMTLTVHIGDANTLLPKLSLEADAWYLDGFSPAKNPELWNGDLMQEVFNHTAADGSFATYTVAGWVRRNLAAAGFTVEKQPGFGSKREMTVGRNV